MLLKHERCSYVKCVEEILNRPNEKCEHFMSMNVDCVLFYTHKEFLYSDVNESAIMYYIYKLLLWCYNFINVFFLLLLRHKIMC